MDTTLEEVPSSWETPSLTTQGPWNQHHGASHQSEGRRSGKRSIPDLEVGEDHPPTGDRYTGCDQSRSLDCKEYTLEEIVNHNGFYSQDTGKVTEL